MAQDAGEEEKSNLIKNIKKAERRNQCFWTFRFHQGTGILAQAIDHIQTPKSWKTMQEFKEDDEFALEDSKKVNKKDESP